MCSYLRKSTLESMHKILSIIVPAYNMQDYIIRCLDSLRVERICSPQLEVIVVDDGSTDETAHLVRQYQETHRYVILIVQQNVGVSAARNTGLHAATGKYVAFVDADDYICEGAVEEILSRIPRTASDLIILDTIVQPNGNHYLREFKNDLSMSCIQDLYSNFGLLGTVWGCLIRNDMLKLHNILFQNDIRNSEDTLFIAECQVCANSFEYWNLDFYNYELREGSAFTTYDLNRLYSYKYCLEKAYNLTKKYTNISKHSRLLLVEVLYLIIANATISSVCCPKGTLKTMLRDIKINDYLPLECYKESRLYSRIMILNFSYYLYYSLFFFIYRVMRPTFQYVRRFVR